MPSKVEPKSQVDRSEFTLSWSALARARVICPLGGLGGVGMESAVGCTASRRIDIELLVEPSDIALTINKSHRLNGV